MLIYDLELQNETATINQTYSTVLPTVTENWC